MSGLSTDLNAELKRHRFFATVNYQAAYWFSALAVLCRVIAGLSVAASWFCTDTLAVLSALPGAILILFDKLKFEERSDWHYRRTYALRSLLYQLKFQDKSEAEVSANYQQMVLDMEQKWPRFTKEKSDDRA